MTHIIIDARLYGPKHTGIGRYTKNLLTHLPLTPKFKDFNISLIIDKSQVKEIKKDLGNNYRLIPVSIKTYSLKEQLYLPFILYRQKPNLVHFTHFNKPIFYMRKSVVTIHDLIKHFYRGKLTTTKNSFFYWPKYLAYLLVSYLSIKTNHIIVPSFYWQQYLINKYKVEKQKIITTHEAVDPNFLKQDRLFVNKPQNYIIYTGNLYLHKNFSIILKALKKLPDLKLKVICSRDVFQKRAQKLAKSYRVSSQVTFLGYLTDEQFKKTYTQALALVHPSFMEGFSLTGLEAMALSCPVISSNSSCLPEIYQNSVLYFDPHKVSQLISLINKLQKSPTLRLSLIKKGYQQVDKYSWHETAKSTINFYQKIL